MRAYHFFGERLRDCSTVPEDGVTLVHEGPLELCRSGFHGSLHPYDALNYAPGRNLHHTNLWGANLSDTIGNMREVKSLQLEQYPITYTSSRLQIGCENYPIERWWEFSEEEIFDMDGQEAVVFWYKYKNHIQSTIKLSPAVKS